ncbi:MAG: amidase, partial [Actinomycetota bacterium]|nr:amidase [Actinomycetota bacterium]
MEPYQLTLSAAAAQIKAGRLSPVELTNSVLDRIDATHNTLHAFVCVTADLARHAAQAAAGEIAAGRYRGPLHGIPLGVKDLYDTAGVASESGSKVRAGYVPHTNAVAVERLFAAGMVMVGKTHTHEFAYGVLTPTTRNPWDTGRVPGGSSGGSGAAVAAGECLVGMGTDTGGSIRIPASYCGIVGVKPTLGLVPEAGVTPLCPSLDHVGTLTRTVQQAAALLSVLAGSEIVL